MELKKEGIYCFHRDTPLSDIFGEISLPLNLASKLKKILKEKINEEWDKIRLLWIATGDKGCEYNFGSLPPEIIHYITSFILPFPKTHIQWKFIPPHRTFYKLYSPDLEIVKQRVSRAFNEEYVSVLRFFLSPNLESSPIYFAINLLVFPVEHEHWKEWKFLFVEETRYEIYEAGILWPQPVPFHSWPQNVPRIPKRVFFKSYPYETPHEGTNLGGGFDQIMEELVLYYGWTFTFERVPYCDWFPREDELLIIESGDFHKFLDTLHSFKNI